MKKDSHVNVTIDFTNWGGSLYDLRIPIQLTVKQLILQLQEIVPNDKGNLPRFTCKVTTKALLLADDDYLDDYPITDGDVLVLL